MAGEKWQGIKQCPVTSRLDDKILHVKIHIHLCNL